MKTISHFDVVWASQLAEFCAQSYAEQIAQITNVPESASQIDYVLAAEYALDCAFVTYAIGAPLEEVRVWLLRASQAMYEVFKLRGTILIKGSEVQDLSLTNSRRGLLAMYAALVAGDRELAESIAELVGDPADASYIGFDSEVCTPDEQQLAYALKALLLGQDVVAYFYVTGLSNSPQLIRYQATAVIALISREPDIFLDALRDLLAAHAIKANDKQNAHEPRCLMCLPGLGLAVLAISSGLVEPNHLPPDNVYLPLAMIESNPLGK